jgi:signal transduction histidine kinase
MVIFVITYQNRQQLYQVQLKALEQEFKHQLTQSQLEIQEYTFRQISEELHDNVGQLLGTTKMLMGITERTLHEVPDSLKIASETLTQAIQDIRSLSKSLSEEWLHQFNIVENLQTELSRINASRIIYASMQTNITLLPLEPQKQVMLFRIMQEALQNSIKHSQPKNIDVAIMVNDDNIYLSLEDNGNGFDANTAIRSGVGMMNMKHRIQLLGGTIEWHSNKNGSTKVEIILPAQN